MGKKFSVRLISLYKTINKTYCNRIFFLFRERERERNRERGWASEVETLQERELMKGKRGG